MWGLYDIEHKRELIDEWREVGGVLAYDKDRDGTVSFYVMDDGEFKDRWRELNTEVDLKYYGITEDNYARLLCLYALVEAKFSTKEIMSLMDW